MKTLNKLFLATLLAGSCMQMSCSEDNYEVNAPSWLQKNIDSIATVRASQGDTFDPESLSFDGWWTNWSKNYTLNADQRVTITIDNFTSERGEVYHNWALIPTNTNWSERNDPDTYYEQWAVRGDGGNWGGAASVEVVPSGVFDKNFMQDGTVWTLVVDNYSNGNLNASMTAVNPSGEEFSWVAKGKVKEAGTIWFFLTGEKASYTISNMVYEDLVDQKPLSLTISGEGPTAVELTEDEVDYNYYWGERKVLVNWANGTSSEVDVDELSFNVSPDLSIIGKHYVSVSYGKTMFGDYTQPVAASFELDVTASINEIKAESTGEIYYYVPGTTQINAADVDAKSFVKSVLGKTGSSDINVPEKEYTAVVKSASLTQIVITVTYKEFSDEITVDVKPSASYKINIAGQDVEIYNQSIVGGGSFVEDPIMGLVFQNVSTTSLRSNFLLLPEDALSHSAESKEMTISFWAKGDENTPHFSPIFSAYAAAPVEGKNTWPMFIMQTRGLAQVNCAGYCDFTPAQNVASANNETNDVTFHDGKWHLIACTLTETSVKYIVDGVVFNEWTIDGSSEGQVVSGLFSNGGDLKYICLGGNQAWDWGDSDSNCAFAKVKILTKAQTVAEIKAEYDAVAQ